MRKLFTLSLALAITALTVTSSDAHGGASAKPGPQAITSWSINFVAPAVSGKPAKIAGTWTTKSEQGGSTGSFNGTLRIAGPQGGTTFTMWAQPTGSSTLLFLAGKLRPAATTPRRTGTGRLLFTADLFLTCSGGPLRFTLVPSDNDQRLDQWSISTESRALPGSDCDTGANAPSGEPFNDSNDVNG